MNQRSKIANIIICAAFLIVIAFFALFALFDKDVTVSEFEGRPLAGMPKFTFSSFFKGEYVSALDKYFSDTFPMRTNMLKANQKLNILYNLPIMQADYYFTPDEQMILYGKAAMELFSYNQAGIDAYADMIYDYRDMLPGQTSLAVLIAPTTSAYNRPSALSDTSYEQKPAIDALYSALSQDSGIRTVDVYDLLGERCAANDYIYFRTDHHWTALGAYYAYSTFVGADNAVQLDGLQKYTLPDFLGSMYKFTSQIPQNVILAENPDDIVYYEMPAQSTVTAYTKQDMSDPTELKLIYPPSEAPVEFKYSAFLYGDHALTKIDSSVQNEKTILVIKDSYANAFLPYLVNNYQTVYVVDPRYFGKADQEKFSAVQFVSDHNISEVLFLNYTMSLRNTDWTGLLRGIM